MNGEWFRFHLLLLGWAAVFVAASFAVWLHYYAPASRYSLDGGLRLDHRTGEVRRIDSRVPGGVVLLEAPDATPTAPPPTYRPWPTSTPTFRTITVIDTDGRLTGTPGASVTVIDDLGPADR